MDKRLPFNRRRLAEVLFPAMASLLVFAVGVKVRLHEGCVQIFDVLLGALIKRRKG